ncbi:hypothetical protein CAL7716_085910 [Calothrix sp. PCC 7716]|nr:hypothetical protein CAL7716_085910 [Calothrix sp. PCC 7716]
MNLVRMFTKKWINKQECLIIGYWGDKENVDLMECLDVYVEALLEKSSTEDAMYDAFSEYADDIDITHTEDENFSYSQMRARFDSCKNLLVFFKGECVELCDIQN